MLKAKFRIVEVIAFLGPPSATSSTTASVKYSERITFMAVYGDTNENKAWAKATPAGQLVLTIDNPDAWGKFNYGDEVYLDISLAGRPERADSGAIAGR